jgi:oxalate decarboxylase/phosphoglucose isomerase-like protein (cupin superfamily)
MAPYTVQNLREIENQGVKFGMDENDIQFRMAKDPLECEHCGVSLVKLGSGWRVPWGHTHKTQEEIYILINGSGRMKVEDEIIEMKPFTAVRVSKDAMRGYEGGPEGAELLVIGAPRTGSGDADVEQGWWSE